MRTLADTTSVCTSAARRAEWAASLTPKEGRFTLANKLHYRKTFKEEYNVYLCKRVSDIIHGVDIYVGTVGGTAGQWWALDKNGSRRETFRLQREAGEWLLQLHNLSSLS